MRVSRRTCLTGLAGAAGCAALSRFASAQLKPTQATDLTIQTAQAEILPGTMTDGLISTSMDRPPPVLQMNQGQVFRSRVTNTLPDYTAMHWHGIRVPNGMDGVPYLTQIPFGQDEAFDYEFTPEDAGTYWYHPHCMTMDQMALGLTGVLTVAEAEDPGYDADIAFNLRDFRLNGDGEFIELWTARGAARAGTKGTVVTANWRVDAREEAPAGGLVRVRLAATDTARIYKVFVPDAEGAVIALDGHPLQQLRALPLTEDGALVLSPGQRADLVIKMPEDEGRVVDIMNAMPGGPRRIAHMRSTGAPRQRSTSEIVPLAPNPLSEPDLSNARLENFVFGWSPDGLEPNNGLCGTLGYTFWSINRTPWAGDAAEGTGPLASFRLGESVVLRLQNESPNAHPIHLHGLTFRVLRSNMRAVSRHWTDTALLLKGETLEIAFVADNPGDWAFHCHVIEHQKTGLAGYISVLA